MCVRGGLLHTLLLDCEFAMRQSFYFNLFSRQKHRNILSRFAIISRFLQTMRIEHLLETERTFARQQQTTY